MLSTVSETAILTLKSRVEVSQTPQPLFRDIMGARIYSALQEQLSDDVKKRTVDRRLPKSLSTYVALRARQYDRYTKAFLKKHPDGLVVSLGCGLDTRFWRLGLKASQYVELDLPPMIDVKKSLIDDDIPYSMLPISVLDHKWIDTIKNIRTDKVLFLAEGLFMYLPEDEVVKLFKALADNFTQSEIVFETVHKKYTQGFYKKMVEMKMKKRLGSDAGGSYQYGILGPEEVEAYDHSLHVISEWSYVEDKDVEPKYMHCLRKFKTVTRSQWTVRVSID